jgi:pimeloyl-ACP methyl ester carboxylesterase
MQLNKSLLLSSGQTLSYLEIGEVGQPACLFFHGFPGSSRQVLAIQSNELIRKFHIIGIDRPGFGDSSFVPDRKLQMIVRSIEELANHLRLSKFHLIAVSGGAPSAFVTADRLPNRVLSLTTICGLGPLHEKEFFRAMGLLGRWLLRVSDASPVVACWVLARLQSKIQSGKMPSREKMLRFFSPEDVDLIFDPQTQAVFRDSMLNAFKQGPAGPALEMRVCQQDWQIQNWDFPFPVHLWHAMQDRFVPPEHSRLLAQRIPRANLHLVENESHYSLPIRKISEILNVLS